MCKPKVLVLMSTYNGEMYIKQQIDSIFKQINVDISLLIRDDGSSDNTVNIITDYNNSNIMLKTGKNIGYKRSFMELVYMCDDNFDYYAFADQDDIWFDDKMDRAIKMLGKVNEPALYYSFMTQVDENLNVMNEQQNFKPPLNKKMVLFQNFVQGSTIVFNKSLLNIVQSYKIPKEVAHDIWLPIVATYFGKVVGDEESRILYRKHSDAVTVKMRNNYWIGLFNRIFSKECVDNFAIYLLDGYKKQLASQEISFLENLRTYSQINNRIPLMFDRNIKKYSAKGTVLLKLSILFGRLEK